MTSKPIPNNKIYPDSEGHNPINLLSLMQKIMLTMLARNIILIAIYVT